MSDELTDQELAELEKKLRQLAVTLPQQLKLSEASGRPVELDQQSVGRLSRMDAIAQQSVSREGIRRLRLRLARVGSAIRRFEEGEYGLCLLCEEPIGFGRLSVAPEATTCVSCQQRRENR